MRTLFMDNLDFFFNKSRGTLQNQRLAKINYLLKHSI